MSSYRPSTPEYPARERGGDAYMPRPTTWPLDCPRCAARMEFVFVPGKALRQCPQCHHLAASQPNPRMEGAL